ncbi:oligosaccharide flippase family protein [Roseovarius tibetensis]|uniref:oligosaccharide flippase family protein n=1 Tax=Roseovarius tibetensis TaxID=2685897 RepID=UPI003D7FB899
MNNTLPPADNTRGLLKSVAVIGSAKFLSILIRIVKAKLVAVMLGPSGTGLLGVFSSLQMLVAQMAGLGLPQSAVRQLASSQGDQDLLARLKSVLFVMLGLQGGVAMAAVWLLREPISVWLLGDAQSATGIGLVGVVILLFLLSSSQQTLLRGMRRINDQSRVMVLGTLAGAVAGIAAILLLGREGLIWFLIAETTGAFLVGAFYVRRLPLPAVDRPPLAEIWQLWKPMVRLGAAFMLGGLVHFATLLVIRTLITRDLGLDAAGQFAAAWTITFTYIGFLVQAMLTDYLPRLIEVIRDRESAARLMNDQMQLALTLGGPLLLVMTGLAPWLIRLLYSAEFDAAATVLQWQMAGAVMMLTTRTMGASFIAAGRSMVFLYIQLQFNALFLLAIWLGLPVLGIEAAGVAYLFAHALQIVMVALLARRLNGFRWQTGSVRIFAATALLVFAMLALARLAPGAAAIAAPALAAAITLIGGRRVLGRIGPQGRLVSRAHRFYAAIGWPVEHSS